MSGEERRATVYTNANGELRVKVDAPGIAAVSAKIDAEAFIHAIADEAGLAVTINDCGD